MVSSGKAPEPIWLLQSQTSTIKDAPTPPAGLEAAGAPGLRSRPASRANSFKVGKRSARRSGSRYNFSVASIAAKRILSTRKARFHRIAVDLGDHIPLATMNPVCGPPSSLSPENVTISAPWRPPRARSVPF